MSWVSVKPPDIGADDRLPPREQGRGVQLVRLAGETHSDEHAAGAVTAAGDRPEGVIRVVR